MRINADIAGHRRTSPDPSGNATERRTKNREIPRKANVISRLTTIFAPPGIAGDVGTGVAILPRRDQLANLPTTFLDRRPGTVHPQEESPHGLHDRSSPR